jgi:hypothetical protein
VFTGCYDRYQFEIPGVDSFVSVIAPNIPAAGNPWVFRVGFVDRDASVDQALLAKGFYIVVGAVPYNYDGPVSAQWDNMYKYLTDQGFSKKPAMEGAGGAAGEAYAWAIENPEKISCIYAENAVMHSNLAKTQPLQNLEPLAKAGVPLLHICGNLDPWFAGNTAVLEKQYGKFGGKIQVVIKPGEGHYLPATTDSKLAVDFIIKNALQ